MKSLKINGIIHLFAILHMAVALACRSLGIADEIWLTLLTVSMLVVIGLKMYAKVEIVIATVIFANFAAWLLGVYGARLLGLLPVSEMLTHGLSTFITTEIIGWSTCGFLHLLKRTLREKGSRTVLSENAIDRRVSWLVYGMVAVILFRIVLTLLFPEDGTSGSLLGIVGIYLSKSGSFIILSLCCIIIMVRYLRRRSVAMRLVWKVSAMLASVVVLSAAMALFACLDFSVGGSPSLTFNRFARLFVVALSFCLISYSIVYMIDYAFAARAAMRAEKDKADESRFQYEKLKQQVNPHFLFNSLNILNCMVVEGKNMQASAFIHKLAGIYRYLLRNDGKVVTLKEEMDFVSMYVDLLKERFADGFGMEADIPDAALVKKVVPCSVQMLIENAIKHNRVGADAKLMIRIHADAGSLTVVNNFLPRLTRSESTKVGLDYIRRQYMNLCGRGIDVSCSGEEYSVTIPLI